VLGGTPQLIMSDIDTGVTFSPDGHRIAYARANDPDVGKFRLLTANADGSDESILLIAVDTADNFPRYVTWSPDGKNITFSVYTLGDALGSVKMFDIGDKQVKPLAAFPNELVSDVAWLPSGQWILAKYDQKGPNYVRSQIGLLSRAGGQIQPVTRDTNEYETLTVSADGKTAATVQERTATSLSLLPGAGTQGHTSVQPLAQGQDVQSIAWSADGKLLVSDGQGVRPMTTGGELLSTILNDPNSWITDMARCGDRYLLLAWAFHGGSNQVHIWRTNADGSNPVQLSKGLFDRYPQCSADGKWVYYYDSRGPHYSARVPIGGGESEFLPKLDVPGMFGMGGGEAISPDGTRLIFNDEINNSKNEVETKLELATLDSGSPSAPLTLQPDPRIASSGGNGFTNEVTFTPDGKFVAYIIRDQGVDNIFVQPFDGSSGHPITNFTTEQIAEFRWSPDGKTLAVARVQRSSDVVLLQEK
jgi:Tol biopolymer transport system component